MGNKHQHKSIKVFTVLILIWFLLFVSNIFAFEFTLNSVEPTKSAAYQTDYASFKSSVTYVGSTCKISCSWYAGQDSESFDCLENTCGFNFNINAQSSQGFVSGTLTVICNLPGSLWPVCISQGDQQKTKTYSFSYPYLGDNVCTTSNNYENCQSALSDCPCSSGMKCMFDISRPKDSRGCTTYCGNSIKESTYETCSSCPTDVGKCDGSVCISGSECEGKYCVHEKCWNKPYKIGDTFCDSGVGENCANSP